jgi:hypothetical protein
MKVRTFMHHHRNTLIVLGCLALPSLLWAQGNSAAVQPALTVDPCRKSVSKFEETIGVIRQAQGNQARE